MNGLGSKVECERSVQKPTRRVILLGASNLVRSISTVIETAREIWHEPIEIMAAIGHGRSYGRETRVFGRKISGIFPSALWKDLQTRAPLPTVALVTDVGNDIGYGVSTDEVIGWVAGCLTELQRAHATTVITQLPIERMERLGEREFLFFRTLFFPRSRLTFDEIRNRARELNTALLQLGDSKNMPVIPVPGTWYGVDPIHLKRSAWREAWPTIVASWHQRDPLSVRPRASFARWAYLRSLAPAERTVWGVANRNAQPSGRLADGTTISLY